MVVPPDPSIDDSKTQEYARPEEGGPQDVRDLLRLFDLDPAGPDRFRAPNPRQQGRPRLYGGQVAAQSLMAAGLTVPAERRPHSLHGYFLRPGRPDRVTDLRVDRVRDGRSFSVRRVVASQDGDEIFTTAVSFHLAEPGVEHQVARLPTGLTAPEDMPEQPQVGHNTMFELREFSDPGAEPRVPPSRLWARTRGPLPDDDLVQAAAVAYLSDMGWAFSQLEPGGGPSIDHAIWFHRPVRADEWLLLDLTPVAAAGARGVYQGTIHDRTGRLVASLAQEALLRRRGS